MGLYGESLSPQVAELMVGSGKQVWSNLSENKQFITYRNKKKNEAPSSGILFLTQVPP